MSKKIKKGLTESKDIKLKKVSKKPLPKEAGVKDQSPKAKNKDSLTDNIKSKSSKSIAGGSLGKITKVPLSQKQKIQPKKKK